MQVLKRVLIPVLCVLVLASAAFADLTKVTKQELQSLIKEFRAAAGPAPAPGEFLKKFAASKAPSAFPTISTDRQYGATQLLPEPMDPFGIGVGTLGDYVLINDAFYGDIWAYRADEMKHLYSSPSGYIAAGRMYGHYYFGDFSGNVFRLETDGSITALFDEIDSFGVFVGSLALDPATGWLAFTLNAMSSSMSMIVMMDPANPEMGLSVAKFPDSCFGVAFRGNYLYASILDEDVIVKYNVRTGAGPFLFTDRVITPGDIQLDAKGNLFVTELMVGDILRFNATATSRKKIAWGFVAPFCLGLDKRGDVFVSDPNIGEVWKLRKKY